MRLAATALAALAVALCLTVSIQFATSPAASGVGEYIGLRTQVPTRLSASPLSPPMPSPTPLPSPTPPPSPPPLPASPPPLPPPPPPQPSPTPARSRAAVAFDQQELLQAPPDQWGVAFEFRNVVITSNGDFEFFGLDIGEQLALVTAVESEYMLDYKFFPPSARASEWTSRTLRSRLVFRESEAARDCTPDASFGAAETVFLLAPWAQDNAWHLHNDNVLPVFTNALLAGALGATAPSVSATDPGARKAGESERFAGVPLGYGTTARLFVMFMNEYRPIVHSLYPAMERMGFASIRPHDELFAANRTCVARMRYGRGPLLNYVKTATIRARVGADLDSALVDVPLTWIFEQFAARAWAAAGLTAADVAPKPAGTNITIILVPRRGVREWPASGDTRIASFLSAHTGALVQTADFSRPLIEQIRQFALADVMLAPSGAGMIMALYMRPGAVVVEGREHGICVPWFHYEVASHRRLRFLGIYFSEYFAARGAEPDLEPFMEDLAHDIYTLLHSVFGVFSHEARAFAAAHPMSNEEAGMPGFFVGETAGEPAASLQRELRGNEWRVAGLRVPSGTRPYVGLWQLHLQASCFRLPTLRFEMPVEEARQYEQRLPMLNISHEAKSLIAMVARQP